MGSITGVVQSNERKSGANGDFAKLNINGQWISFFPPSAEAAFKIKTGSTVQVDFTEKGQYKNGKSITLVSGLTDSTIQSTTQDSVGFSNGGLPKGSNESMILSYVKDMMVSGATPENAVDAIFTAYELIKLKANPTTPSTT